MPFGMGLQKTHDSVIRYRGFLLLEQPNQTWLVRPERSPMLLLPFRTKKCSLIQVKAFLDERLAKTLESTQAA